MPTIKTTFVLDLDRLNLVLQTVYQNIISVYLKVLVGSSGSAYNLKIFKYNLSILFHLASIPASVKFWKRDVWEFFLEPRFFQLLREADIPMWKKILQVIVIQEGNKFTEVLSKCTCTKSVCFCFLNVCLLCV